MEDAREQILLLSMKKNSTGYSRNFLCKERDRIKLNVGIPVVLNIFWKDDLVIYLGPGGWIDVDDLPVLFGVEVRTGVF